MIGLDTNVVVRLLVRDDAGQLRRAEAAITRHCSGADPGRISNVVLVEVVWVLGSVYGFPKALIVGAIEALLQVQELSVADPAEAWEALHLFRDGPADFSDYFLAVLNREAGCGATITFDRKAARHPLFRRA